MDMEKLVALCRRKGFIFQSSEIYGGINGFWDYGPLGVLLKKNIKDAWWQDMVMNPPAGPDGQEIQMAGVDCAIIMNPRVWEASGHVGGFADLMVDCRECKSRLRADKVWVGYFSDNPDAKKWWHKDNKTLTVEADSGSEAESRLEEARVRATKKKKMAADLKLVERFPLSQAKATFAQTHIQDAMTPLDEQNPTFPCPDPKTQGCQGALTEPRAFNLMLETYVGAVRDDENKAYLRPETAQGIFVNYQNVLNSTRLKLPFGIAQIGKAFRNEINPRNYIFRSREFEQMEIEFFCHPSESMKWYQYWRDVRIGWYERLGIRSDRLRPREQTKDELAFYSVGTTDIEYLFPFADEPQELEGVAHRGDYDLRQHAQHSGKDLSYFDEDGWNRLDRSAWAGDKKREQEEKAKFRYLPHVIEPSAGADRFALAVLCEAYDEDEIGGEKRTVMRFHPRLAPVKAAVFPLVNKDGMPEKSLALYHELKKDFSAVYDDKGAVGRRYRRQDEAGTPWCITIDGQTLQDDTVTIRERDSTKQSRVQIGAVAAELRERLRPS
jgi:glycyl-tRNA synthetase